jgi:hypothetical protein
MSILDIIGGIGNVVNSCEDLLGGMSVGISDHVVVIQISLQTPCKLDFAVCGDIVDQLSFGGLKLILAIGVTALQSDAFLHPQQHPSGWKFQRSSHFPEGFPQRPLHRRF